MRLVKFFPEAKSVDKNINAWVQQSSQQRCILQIMPYKEGVMVLYEKVSSEEKEWESVKKRLMKKGSKQARLEMLKKDVITFLRQQQFLTIGTSDLKNRPHTSAKPLLKIEDNFIYLIDYVIGNTFKNLEANPKASLSSVDIHKVVGYQIYGTVEVLNKGSEYEKLLKEMHKKQVNMATERMINGLQKGSKSKGYEIVSLKVANIIKVRVKEVTKLNPNGDIEKEVLERDK